MSTELSTQRVMGIPSADERCDGEQQASVASPTLTRKATRNHWRALITVATLVVLCGNAGVWYVYSRQYATGDATATDQHGVNSGKATLRYVSDVAANSDNSQRRHGRDRFCRDHHASQPVACHRHADRRCAIERGQ